MQKEKAQFAKCGLILQWWMETYYKQPFIVCCG